MKDEGTARPENPYSLPRGPLYRSEAHGGRPDQTARNQDGAILAFLPQRVGVAIDSDLRLKRLYAKSNRRYWAGELPTNTAFWGEPCADASAKPVEIDGAEQMGIKIDPYAMGLGRYSVTRDGPSGGKGTTGEWGRTGSRALIAVTRFHQGNWFTPMVSTSVSAVRQGERVWLKAASLCFSRG